MWSHNKKYGPAIKDHLMEYNHQEGRMELEAALGFVSIPRTISFVGF